MSKDVITFDNPKGSLTRLGLVDVWGWDDDVKAWFWRDMLDNQLLTFEVKVVLALDGNITAEVSPTHYKAVLGEGLILRIGGLWLYNNHAQWVLSPDPLNIYDEHRSYTSPSMLGEYTVVRSGAAGVPAKRVVSLDTSWWRGWKKDSGHSYLPLSGGEGTRRAGYGVYNGSFSGMAGSSPTWVEERLDYNGRSSYSQGSSWGGSPVTVWWDGSRWAAGVIKGTEDELNAGWWMGGSSLSDAFILKHVRPSSVVDDYEARFEDTKNPNIKCLTLIVTPPVPSDKPLRETGLPALSLGYANMETPVYKTFYSVISPPEIKASAPTGWRLEKLVSNKGETHEDKVPAEWLDDDLVVQAIFEPSMGNLSLSLDRYDVNIHAEGEFTIAPCNVWRPW